MTEAATNISTAGTYDVDDVATLLKSSSRHVRRLADSGAMPRPIHIGRLVRWNKATVEQWLAAGCPPCHPISKRGAK